MIDINKDQKKEFTDAQSPRSETLSGVGRLLVRPFLILLLVTMPWSLVMAKKPMKISLKESKEAYIKQANFNIVEIVDSRENKSHLGLLPATNLASTRFVVFEESFDRSFGQFVRSAVAPADAAIDVRLEVIHLQIYISSWWARAEVTMTVYGVGGSGDGILLDIVHQFTERKLMISKSDEHAKNLALAALKVLFKLDELVESGESIGSVKAAEVSDRPDGVYRSFEAFKNAKPTMTDEYHVKLNDNTAKLNFNAQNDGNVVFAFVDGEAMYIRFLGDYYKLQELEDGYVFQADYSPNERAMSKNTIYAGAIGAALTRITSGQYPKYFLNMSTGQITRVR